jgi:phage shock protein PspC (stress-responsive transcriptional regulator)
MKGKILDFSVALSEGKISGDDGNRYTFSGKEWKSQTLPSVGLLVDFDTEEKVALCVYLDGPAKAVSTVNSPADITGDERYRSFYCSSDEKILLGFCGGLAHKFNLPIVALRVIVFVTFFVGLLYFVGIFLPKLPTKDVPRSA